MVGTRIDARLDVVAKTSESGAAMAGCPRFPYFFISVRVIFHLKLLSSPRPPNVHSQGRRLALFGLPVPEGNFTLSQGAQSSWWAIPRGIPGPVASQKRQLEASCRPRQADDGAASRTMGCAGWQDGRMAGWQR